MASRAAFVLKIRPDKVAEYVAAHRAVWPEMRQALSAAGFRNYSIFLHGDEAIGYFEADDVDAAFAHMAATDVNRRWQDAMAHLLDARIADEGPQRLEEIFRLE